MRNLTKNFIGGLPLAGMIVGLVLAANVLAPSQPETSQPAAAPRSSVVAPQTWRVF